MADESQKQSLKPDSSEHNASASPPSNIPVGSESLSSQRPVPPRPQPMPAPRSSSPPPPLDRPKSEPPKPAMRAMPSHPGGPEPAPQQDKYKEAIRPQVAPFDPTQKKALLNRGEVSTMQKDVAELREEEARKERERISQLKAQQDAEKERTAVQKIRQAAEATKKQEESQKREQLQKIQDSILPPGEEQRVQNLPQRPSHRRKVFVRTIIIVIFAFIALNLVLLAYWFFSQGSFVQIPFFSSEEQPAPSPTPTPPSPVEPAPQPTPQPPPTGGPEPTPQPSPTPSSLTNPIISLVKPVHTSTLQFSSQGDLSSLLGQSLGDSQPNGFTQLMFRNAGDQSVIGQANDLLGVFQAQASVEVAQLLSQSTLFFSYPTERGNRFGIIVELKDTNTAIQTLSTWESQMEDTLSPLMSFWGQKGAGYTSSFRSSAHQGVEVRFQTFSTQDYGIVYAIVDKYLILASSFDATKAAIETLQASTSSLSEPAVFGSIGASGGFKPPPNLSFEQAVGQVLMIGFNDAELTPELKDIMRRLQPGGVLLLSRNIQSVGQLKQLTQDLQRVSLEYSKLPLLIAVDQEGGDISRIEFGKEKTAQSAIETTDHAYVVGQERAEELKFLGVNLNLSPVLDTTNPEDFLFDRTFKAERFETGKLAKALLAGQKDVGILSTVKHFPGYGNITFNPEKVLATVQGFPDISPFVFALPENPEFVLLSNVIYKDFDPNQPFTFSEKGMDVLRNELGFQGIILSDDLVQPALLDNYSFEEIVSLPLEAGVNMIMFSKQPYAADAYETLLTSAKENPRLKRKLENSAAKILQMKKQFFFESENYIPLDHLSQNK